MKTIKNNLLIQGCVIGSLYLVMSNVHANQEEVVHGTHEFEVGGLLETDEHVVTAGTTAEKVVVQEVSEVVYETKQQTTQPIALTNHWENVAIRLGMVRKMRLDRHSDMKVAPKRVGGGAGVSLKVSWN